MTRQVLQDFGVGFQECIAVIYSYAYTHAYTCRIIHNDKRIKGRAKTSLNTYVPLTLFVTFVYERELETEQNCNILWPSALCLSHSPGLLNRRPRSSLCWVMPFFTASYQQLLWTPTHQGPNGPFGLAWISLPHLISNFSSNSFQLSDFCLD